MKRHIPGLRPGAAAIESVLEGLFLVRVERTFYRWHPQKPFFSIRFAVLKPSEHAGQTITGRIYCSPKALWKLSWFLRDFGYDMDLLGREEVDERALLGLRGIVRLGRTSINGRSFINLEAFAPEAEWEELPEVSGNAAETQESRHDL
jgi:hypothetical protein